MGITGLNDFLKKYPKAINQVHMSHFAYKRIAFDISSYIYRYMAIYGKDQNKWMNAFLFLMCLFRQHALHVVPIFDGKAPPEKIEEKQDRGVQRDKSEEKSINLSLAIDQYKQTGECSEILVQTMKHLIAKQKKDDEFKKMKSLLRPSVTTTEKEEDVIIDIKMLEDYVNFREKGRFDITSEDIDLLKSMLDVLKIPYVQAPDEAEALANYLVKQGMADATFSLDSDCMAYQVPMIIKDLDTKTGIFKIIDFSNLCTELDMSPDQFTLMCIIMSCDYNRHTKKIKGVGPVTAAKMVKKWNTYEEIKKNEKAFQIPDDGLRYDLCVELFNPSYPQFDSVNMVWDLDVDFDKAEEFFKSHKIPYSIEKIKQLWAPTELVFED